MERQFDAAYIGGEFERIGSRVKRPVGIYLIGGCSMSLRGLKESTKDVDVVFRDAGDYKAFCDALFGAGYSEPAIAKKEHERLEARAMYENGDGFHLDLFVKSVLGKLSLSEPMAKRAEFYKTYGNLSVHLVAKEDIFLFKGLASEGRKRDLPDMRVLYPGLDWKIVEGELLSQELSEGLVGLFMARLEEFGATYRVDVPLLGRLKKRLAGAR